MRSFLRHNRLHLLAFGAAFGLGMCSGHPLLRADTEDELRQKLSAQSGLHVEQMLWEPSDGLIGDLWSGRRLLFLASLGADSPRDLYRAEVRLSPGGAPLQLLGAVNLTNTSDGDEHELVASGSKVAFSTYSYGAEQAVTVLDVAGEGAQNLAETRFEKLMTGLSNWQNTGTWAGLGRYDVVFEEPVKSVQIALKSDTLVLQLERDNAQSGEHLELDLSQPELSPSSVRVEAARHLPKRFEHWAVDSVRAVTGPEPIAWLEEKVFAARDQARQLAHSGSGEQLKDGATLEAEVLPPANFDEAQPVWPPASIASPWETPEPGEGEWTEPTQPWLKRLPASAGAPGAEAAPLPFRVAFVRPDEKRPYVRVLLVAMDMRQLELGMEAGVEDPKPLSGPGGTGRLPRKPEVYQRTVAAFNGGFKTEHGHYGMMVDKRVLLPAVPGGATVGTLAGGDIVFGTWGKDVRAGGPPAPAELFSFRQNMDPLLEDGVVNPTKRTMWGFTLPGTSMQTERSGLCMTAQGLMIYAWGEDLSGDTLGKAMRLASCTYGIHLDMNPHHTGFTFTAIEEIKGKQFKSELLTKKMTVSPERYISYAPKDFFYVMLRDPSPTPLPATALSGAPPSEEAQTLPWQPLAVQPPPAFLAALHQLKLGEVELLSLAPGRTQFRLRAGDQESQDSAAVELDKADAARVLLAAGLGGGRRLLQLGSSTLGHASQSAHSAWLFIDAEGQLRAGAEDEAKAGSERIEVQWLAQDGAALAGAKPASLAVGFRADGHVLLARAAAASNKPAAALLAAGAVQVVGALGEGGGTYYLGGSDTPPRARYTEATLSVLGRSMLPRVKRFSATVPYEKPAPKR